MTSNPTQHISHPTGGDGENTGNGEVKAMPKDAQVITAMLKNSFTGKPERLCPHSLRF